MGFSAFDSQPDPGSRPSAHSQPASSPQDDGYRALLEVVLQQTLLAQDEQAAQKPESLDALLQVARQRRGEPFALDPVGIELVQTVLRKPFRALMANDEQWRLMTAQVAQTLCDDPPSFDRLSTLWRRLGERCGNGEK